MERFEVTMLRRSTDSVIRLSINALDPVNAVVLAQLSLGAAWTFVSAVPAILLESSRRSKETMLLPPGNRAELIPFRHR